MSDYQGNIIIKNPATPTGPFENGAAPGVWKLSDVLPFVRQGIWPTQGIQGKDSFFPYVSLLLSTTSLGNANNNLLVDSSGAFNPVSRNANTTQGSFTPYATNWSNYFDGSGDWISAPNDAAFDFGSGDFTVEFWINFNSVSGTIGPIGKRANETVYSPFLMEMTSSALRLYMSTSGSSWAVNGLATPTLSVETWYHIAVSRSGTTVYMFVNGVSVGSTASLSGAVMTNTSPFYFGANSGSPSGAAAFNGYMSNVRIVKGTALYTSAFTPSTTPLTAVSGTSLLTCQSNRFRDASTNNFTITVTGNTSVTDFSPFSPSTYAPIAYNQSDITNWSGYFDGSGDYLSVPDNAALNMAGSTFTLECWIYPNGNYSDYRTIMSKRNASTTSYQMFLFQTTGYLSFSRANTAYQSSATPTANAWNHVAAVYDGTNINLYLNGTRVLQTAVSIADTADPLLIGAIYTGGENFNGYISNARVLKGVQAYSGATITVPTTPLTAISGTSLLTLQNAAFTDNSINSFPITITGNTTVTGNSPFNTVGYWSNYFDGNGDYLSLADSAALQMSSGDFTVEFWWNPVSISGYQTPFEKGYTGSGAILLQTGNGDGKIIVYASGSTFITASTAVTVNAWNHIALVRNGTSLVLYLNGVSVGSAVNSTNFNSAGAVGIGANVSGGGAGVYPVNGYMSNVRVVKGTAVYTAAFTVPTTPLTAITNTSLLTCQNGRFIDNSTNNFTITVNGDVSVQSFDPFYTSTIASNGGSIYFDGSGDYLALQNNPSYALGSGDFTLEVWLYPITQGGHGSSNNDCIIDFRPGSSPSGYGTLYLFSNGSSVAWYTVSAGNAISGGPIPNGAWSHVMVSRVSGSTRMFINGVQVGSTFADSTNYLQSNPWIGQFNDGVGSGWFQGYMSGMRIVKGSGVSSAFTPPTAPRNPTAATTLLLNGMNAGVYDGTTINDIETVGNAQVRFPSPYAPANYYAGAFDGSGDYARISSSQTALQFGTGDFTVEGWVYSTGGTGTYQQILTGGTSWTSGSGGVYWYYNGGSPYVGAAWNQIATNPAVNSGTLAINTWHHFAVVRSGNTLTLYVNGTSVDTLDVTGVSMAVNNQSQTNIGGGGWDQDFAGYLSNLRVVKGTAVYTNNFTPSTTPLTAISGTSLLTCQNKTFIDNSTNAFTITAFGNATAGAIGPFTATGGTSVYFDGSGDYLSTPTTDALKMNGNFTWEAWVYPLSLPGGGVFKTLWSQRATLSDYGGPLVVIDSAGNLQLYIANNSATGWSVSGFDTNLDISLNTWQHLALVKNGTTLTLYKNGIAGSSTTHSTAVGANGNTVAMAGSADGGQAVDGYMDDFRITNGVARYTTNFTPPTQPFPPY